MPTTPELDVDMILERLLPARLIKIFQRCDNVTAARVAAEHLEKLQDQLALNRHQEMLDRIGDDPMELARYYGHLDLARRDLRAALGREISTTELRAYQEGRRIRVAEMRALEMHRARRGHRIEPWMTRC